MPSTIVVLTNGHHYDCNKKFKMHRCYVVLLDRVVKTTIFYFLMKKKLKSHFIVCVRCVSLTEATIYCGSANSKITVTDSNTGQVGYFDYFCEKKKTKIDF